MNAVFREMLAFHIEAQRGMFLDEAARAPDASGVWAFSSRETDPTWNVFYVLDARRALRSEPRIAREFKVRNREPVWYVADCDAVTLPAPWRRFSSDRWMARGGCADGADAAVRIELRLAETAAERDTFNRLYLDAFWEGAPARDAALPIADERAGNGWLETRHWLAREAGEPRALLSIVSHGGVAALYNVGTLRAARGRGLATALLRAVLAEETRRGAARFFLLTERDKPLETFYGRLGFQTVTTGGYYRKPPAT